MDATSDNILEELKQRVVDNASCFAFKLINIQHYTSVFEDRFEKHNDEFQNFLKTIDYKGGDISEFSSKKATDILSEDGLFGIKLTSKRISEFVLDGAIGNKDILHAGKKGIILGFERAKKLWKTKSKPITEETMKKSIDIIDSAISQSDY